MFPTWLTPTVPVPSENLRGHLTAAEGLIPKNLLRDSGLARDLRECASDGQHHFWMNSLQDVGWFAQENGRDGELPPQFWVHVATAAGMMDFPQFVPYCLGKARGLPRQDVPDLMAAFATMPVALGPVWRRQHDELARTCDSAAADLRRADPATAPLIDAGDLRTLSNRLADGGALDRAEEISELMADVFDSLIACATAEDFPEDRADHAWAVIATNPFRVVVSKGLFPATHAEVWWRAS